ncbi:MAG: MAE_28990/MAE_18760 family HEPN-like nuclease [Hyphomicrobiales bacterium]|uniref:MAE_28990/MAE_18760 family HEPN-like nuclease n=1 Tax=Roseobacteraceae TaxID=2854170 RepID=UPI00327DF46D
MSKIRTLNEMQTALDQEMAWRIKEIGVFKVGAGSNGPRRKPFIRAGVALLYAHWEGFIKNSSEIYLSYVESRALRYRDLKSCFVVFGLKGKINTLVDSKKSLPNVEAMDFILSNMNETAKLQISSAVNTGSNLTSKVFSNIAGSLDIDTSPYETKFHLIDSSLVDRRNKVAHGEFLDIEGSDFSSLVDDMLSLMRMYKTDIENAASLENYRRAA